MFFEVCADCGHDFPQYAEWQTRCYRCYRLHKDKHRRKRGEKVEVEWGNPFAGNPSFLPVEETRQQNKDAVWLRANVKELLHLCHPDKHGGSEQSNKITRELIKIFKER